MKLDLVDALALALGLFYGACWMSLRRSPPVQAPVSGGASWRRIERAELRALTLMTAGCFAKILVDLGIQGLAPRLGISSRMQSATSMAVDLCWMALMFLGLWIRASTRQERAKLGMPPR